MAGSHYERSDAMWTGLSLSPTILAACVSVAKRGKEYAEATAPESPPGQREEFDQRFGARSDRRRYKDSFSVEETVTLVRGKPRVAARLVNDNDIAAAVEFGNYVTPIPHRTLSRTAEYLRGS